MAQASEINNHPLEYIIISITYIIYVQQDCTLAMPIILFSLAY